MSALFAEVVFIKDFRFLKNLQLTKTCDEYSSSNDSVSRMGRWREKKFYFIIIIVLYRFVGVVIDEVNLQEQKNRYFNLGFVMKGEKLGETKEALFYSMGSLHLRNSGFTFIKSLRSAVLVLLS